MSSTRKRRTRGTGSAVLKRRVDGSQAWYAVYRLHGRQKWEFAGDNRPDAEALASQRCREIREGLTEQLEPGSFESFAERWLRAKRAKGVKASTAEDYEIIIKRHLTPALDEGRLSISDITPARVENYVAAKRAGIAPIAGPTRKKKGLAAKTIRNQLIVLGGICELAVRDGHISRNPVRAIDKPRGEEREPLFLTRDQIERLTGAMDGQWQPFTLLLAYVGIRLGEARALRWSDVDTDQSLLRIRKSASRKKKITSVKTRAGNRDLRLSERLLTELAAHRRRMSPAPRPSDLIFASPAGGPIDGDSFRKNIFKPAIAAAKLPNDDERLSDLRVHDLRHSYCSLMIREKPRMHPRTLQALLGHAHFETTMRIYAHVAPEHLAAPDAALD